MILPSIPYPSKFAARRSQQKHAADWKRLTDGRPDPNAERWKTVRLRKNNGKWFLVYNDAETGTGGFDTFQKAVAWYANGGR